MAQRLQAPVIGYRFGFRVVVGEAYANGKGIRVMPCSCECGNVTNVTVGKILRGIPLSCQKCSTRRLPQTQKAEPPKIGSVIGKWTVISGAHYTQYTHNHKTVSCGRMKCRCLCGTIQDCLLTNLLRIAQHHTSSGCLKCKTPSIPVGTRLKHGASYSRLYRIWSSMLARCRDGNTAVVARYYAKKGIRVCEEWREFKEFQEWALKNGYLDNLTIERVDSDKNYCPENCEWITRSENGHRAAIVRIHRENILKNRVVTLEARVEILEKTLRLLRKGVIGC